MNTCTKQSARGNSGSAVNTIVYCGPTLQYDEATQLLPGASIRGPAAFGDIYQAYREGYRRLVIIDGYFDQRAAVWHKEILYVLWQGCEVHGAASMGALRAVELARYGMKGHGQIFNAYLAGMLESDDEVVVAHESDASGYRATSVALINLRATLGAASQQGIISAEQATLLSDKVEALFYTERNYPALLSTGQAAGISPEVLTNLAQFIALHAVDQKQRDARTLLTRLSTQPPQVNSRPNFLFNKTDAWDTFLKGYAARQIS